MHYQPTFKTTHYLFIVDENGINYFFPLIKEKLVENPFTHVSLIYYSPDSRYLFKRELDVLEKHFPSQFIPYYESRSKGSEGITSEVVETIYSSNTRKEILPYLSGTEEFMEVAKSILYFLGIDKIVCQSILFNLD